VFKELTYNKPIILIIRIMPLSLLIELAERQQRKFESRGPFAVPLLATTVFISFR